MLNVNKKKCKGCKKMVEPLNFHRHFIGGGCECGCPIGSLEKRVKELEEKVQGLENPPYPMIPFQVPSVGLQPQFDPHCLHNACRHDITQGCSIFCPHCGAVC